MVKPPGSSASAVQSKGSVPQAKCPRVYAVEDCATGRILAGGRACFRRDCPSCKPKRRAEDMERVRLRLEGWMLQKADGVGFTSPTFVSIGQDPQRIPFEEASAGYGEWQHRGDLDSDEYQVYAEALRIEDRGFRRRVTEMLRYINRTETRAGRPRVDWFGCVERGPRTGNLHFHCCLDRVVRVEVWRKAAYAAGIIGAPGRGGGSVEAKHIYGGARGGAAYFSKMSGYLSKDEAAEFRPKGARALMHSRGCIPSIPVWRALRRKGYVWTPVQVVLWWRPESRAALRQLAGLSGSAAGWRSFLEEQAPEGSVLVRLDQVPGGGVDRTLVRVLSAPSTPEGLRRKALRDEFVVLSRVMMGELGTINLDAMHRKRLARAAASRRPLLLPTGVVELLERCALDELGGRKRA